MNKQIQFATSAIASSYYLKEKHHWNDAFVGYDGQEGVCRRVFVEIAAVGLFVNGPLQTQQIAIFSTGAELPFHNLLNIYIYVYVYITIEYIYIYRICYCSKRSSYLIDQEEEKTGSSAFCGQHRENEN